MSDRTTFVSFLLDETGSMASIRDETIDGFNAYVEELQQSGADIQFSLVSFNSNRTTRRYVGEPVAGVVRLTADDYVPDAMTPLIDATVKLIKATEEAVRHRGDDPRVMVVVQTDGMENVSVEYDNRDLAALIKEKTAAGWQFVFLGAGLDAFAAARDAGIMLSSSHIASYGRTRSRQAFRAMAENTLDYAESGDEASLQFKRHQREDLGDDHRTRGSGGTAGRSKRSGDRGRAKKGSAGSTVGKIDLKE